MTIYGVILFLELIIAIISGITGIILSSKILIAIGSFFFSFIPIYILILALANNEEVKE